MPTPQSAAERFEPKKQGLFDSGKNYLAALTVRAPTRDAFFQCIVMDLRIFTRDVFLAGGS
jgi:hypothetical protein